MGLATKKTLRKRNLCIIVDKDLFFGKDIYDFGDFFFHFEVNKHGVLVSMD